MEFKSNIFANPSEITPLSIKNWRHFLELYPHIDSEWLLDGLVTGFKLGFSGDPPISADSNCPSAKRHGKIVDNYYKMKLNME